jgi:hypothetical protein
MKVPTFELAEFSHSKGRRAREDKALIKPTSKGKTLMPKLPLVFLVIVWIKPRALSMLHARQEFYHLCYAPQPFSLYIVFEIGSC